MKDPNNRNAGAFVLMGMLAGGVLIGSFAGIYAWGSGYDAGTPHGQCLEACLPDVLVQTLSDNTCRCDHDRLVRPRSKAAARERVQ